MRAEHKHDIFVTGSRTGREPSHRLVSGGSAAKAEHAQYLEAPDVYRVEQPGGCLQKTKPNEGVA